MKKNKSKLRKNTSDITPEEGVAFLESIRTMMEDKDEPTKAISLRVPNNLLTALKIKAKADHSKYQTLIVEYIRQGLRRS